MVSPAIFAVRPEMAIFCTVGPDRVALTPP
jgi:hypothetical protein